MSTTIDLAKMAFFSLDRQTRQRILTKSELDSDHALPPDLLAAAQAFIDRGFAVVKDMGAGYDPEYDRRIIAEEAVIRYASLKLQGIDPLIDQSFAQLIRVWVRNAAKNS